MACVTCNKTELLKRCAKCHTEQYCSRDCQKAHWKTHKRVCASRAAANNHEPSPLQVSVDKPFHKLDVGTWLHDRPEQDVYKLLIDSFRLRLDDAYKFDGNATVGSIFNGESNSLPAFTRFLRLAESKQGSLPSWWSAAKAKECIDLGMKPGDNWYSLSAAPEKSDFVEHYGDPRMPMQMRMFVEDIYGRGPGGMSGASMRGLMMAQEASTMPTDMRTSHLDVSGSFNRK